MNQTTLLIVDDNPVYLRTVSAYFNQNGFTVRTAANCADALKSAEELRPDCMLLDYHLTGGDGSSVCYSLRADTHLRKMPIIMVSGDPTQEMPAYTDYKADGFLLKCTPLAKVQAVVETVLRRVNWERGILQKGDLRLEKETLQIFRGHVPTVTLSEEQFDLLFMLVEKSPEFVSEETITGQILGAGPEVKSDAVRALLHRLRQRLGPQLGRRIKGKRRLGWTYVQPRRRASSRPK
ncbi:MAG: response regulator transcription factor [Elusimicrobiales bacterium]